MRTAARGQAVHPAVKHTEYPLVTILGRPNVGKSTLFNALIRSSGSITSPVPGTTRDWIEGNCNAGDKYFRIADTCGWATGGELGDLMDASVASVVGDAALALVVVSARDSLHDQEKKLAQLLRERGVPALLAVSKCDRPEDDAAAWEFASLGLGGPLPVSGLRQRNLGELRQRLATALFSDGLESEPGPRLNQSSNARTRCILLGQPNVGKSSLFNAILKRPRSLVHSQPGTTRDPVRASVDIAGAEWELVDTAGVGQGWKHGHGENASISRDAQYRGIRSLNDADVVVLLLDVTTPFARQDLRLAQMATRRGPALVVALNKCDLVKNRRHVLLRIEAAKYLPARFPQLGRFPIVLSSALDGMGVEAITAAVAELAKIRSMTVPAGALADMAYLWPTSGRPWKVRQTRTSPPTFSARPPVGNKLKPRFVINRIRDAFGLHGVPILLEWSRGGGRRQ